jgi:hypothetical protein
MDEIQARMAGLQMYAVFMRATDKFNIQTDEGREVLRQHLQFQLSMEDRGILLAAGPVNVLGNATAGGLKDASKDRPIFDASGMYFIVAGSQEEAERIAASEPFTKLGWRESTVCSWRVNEGVGRSLVKEMLEKAGAKA